MVSALGSHFRRSWLALALLSTLCVLVLTHIPQERVPKALQQDLLDKLEHVVAYGVIAYLLMRSVRKPSVAWVLLLGLGLVLLGALDELTQPLVNRCASVADFAADVIGIGGGAVISLARR